ncbi:alpha/beta fold hydrolase [Undibacterium arcticum]
MLGLFIADPIHATPNRVKVYQQPLVVTGSTQAIGEWLPVLFAGDRSATSGNPASYKSLKMPVVIVWGERDTITPLSQGQHLASITPGAELLVMPQVGHIPQIEDGPQFTALLQKIFAKLKDLP